MTSLRFGFECRHKRDIPAGTSRCGDVQNTMPCGTGSSHCHPVQTWPRHSRSRSARCRSAHHIPRSIRVSPPCCSGCQYLHLARPVTLRYQGSQWLTRDVSESSDLASVCLHPPRGLSRAVQRKGVHGVLHNGGKSNLVSCACSHQSRSLTLVARHQGVQIVTPCVVE